MYLEASYFITFPPRSSVRPRERFKQYYRDLHARYKLPLDELTLLEGSQYKFHELINPIFKRLTIDKLIDKIDTMVLTHWAHEYDQDYATLGPHLAFRHNLNWTMFDILDQGSICSMIALSILSKLKTQKIVCVSMDQTTIPRSNSNEYSVPTMTASGAFCISKVKPNNHAIQIVACEIWLENKLCERNFDVISLILESLNTFQIKIADCILSCKRNSALYRSIKFHKHKYKQFTEKISFNFRPINTGCTEVFHFVEQLKINSIDKSYVLYMDEDSDSLTSGLLILAIPQIYRERQYAA